MDGCFSEWMMDDGWIDVSMKGWMDGCGWMDELIDG